MELYLNTPRTARILVEEGNFTLQTAHTRKGGKNEGAQFWKLRGYYGTLEGALAASVLKASVHLKDQRIPLDGADITRIRTLLLTIVSAQEAFTEAAGDFMPAAEAHEYEGQVFGDEKPLDNVWSDQ